jgi:predicted DNA-binding protein
MSKITKTVKIEEEVNEFLRQISARTGRPQALYIDLAFNVLRELTPEELEKKVQEFLLRQKSD